MIPVQEELIFVLYKLPTVVISRRADQYGKAFETLMGQQPQQGFPKSRGSCPVKATSATAAPPQVLSSSLPASHGALSYPISKGALSSITLNHVHPGCPTLAPRFKAMSCQLSGLLCYDIIVTQSNLPASPCSLHTT